MDKLKAVIRRNDLDKNDRVSRILYVYEGDNEITQFFLPGNNVKEREKLGARIAVRINCEEEEAIGQLARYIIDTCDVEEGTDYLIEIIKSFWAKR